MVESHIFAIRSFHSLLFYMKYEKLPIINSDDWLSLKDLPNEKWRMVLGFEGSYKVSNYGRVKSLRRLTGKVAIDGKQKGYYVKERILRILIDKKGYSVATLYKNQKGKKAFIHRIVGECFLANPNNLPQINHIDENKQNNISTNLEWCTAKYNDNYGNRNKKLSNRKRIFKKKIICKPIELSQYDLLGNKINTYSSILEASKATNIDVSGISKCCNGIYKQFKGYIWKPTANLGNRVS